MKSATPLPIPLSRFVILHGGWESAALYTKILVFHVR